MIAAFLLSSILYSFLVGFRFSPDAMGSISEVGHFGKYWITGICFQASLGIAHGTAVTFSGLWICPSRRGACVVAVLFAFGELISTGLQLLEPAVWQFIVGQSVLALGFAMAVIGIALSAWNSDKILENF